jgi:hypothetical protein
MPTPQPRNFVFIGVISINVLIDAFLFAQVHANYVHDHGYDVRPRHPAVAKPAPPRTRRGLGMNFLA